MGVDRWSTRYDPAGVYSPDQRRARRHKLSPAKPPQQLPTRFPDEDHAYEPQRRVLATRIHNTIPPPLPVPLSRGGSRRQRLANFADSQLWGFPVKYSPDAELREQWEAATAQQAAALAREQAEQATIEAEARRVENEKAQAALSRQDYALYLYLASKYGPLDPILYCCTAFPGRLYALVVDQSARKLQRWQRQRVLALREYWITTLAFDVVESSQCQGITLTLRTLDHQRNAATFLRQLRWRAAASAFRSWCQFTLRQAEVRWRFQFAMDQDVRARFVRWRQRVADVKAFKRQLKTVARRKQLHAAWGKWQAWQGTQQRVRVHIQQQWTRLQRECLSSWRVTARQLRRARLAATCVQKNWRVYWLRRWYTRALAAAVKINVIVRGFLARRRVRRRRERVAVMHALERITRVIEWDELCGHLQRVRVEAASEEVEVARLLDLKIHEQEREAAEFVRTELAKVRKNDFHHQLQHRIQELQDNGLADASGRRTRSVEVLTQAATQWLIDQQTAVARQRVMGLHPQRRMSSGGWLTCGVCGAARTALERSGLEWRSGYPTLVPHCPHAKELAATDLTDTAALRVIYDRVLSEAAAHDAAIRHDILHSGSVL